MRQDYTNTWVGLISKNGISGKCLIFDKLLQEQSALECLKNTYSLERQFKKNITEIILFILNWNVYKSMFRHFTYALEPN